MDIKYVALLAPALGITLSGGLIAGISGAASTHRTAQVRSASETDYQRGFKDGVTEGNSQARSAHCGWVPLPDSNGTPYEDGFVAGFESGWNRHCRNSGETPGPRPT